jgi:hypothetical protein
MHSDLEKNPSSPKDTTPTPTNKIQEQQQLPSDVEEELIKDFSAPLEPPIQDFSHLKTLFSLKQK